MPNPNTAFYPGAVPTDANLMVAKDNAFTTLNGSISNLVTTINFTNGSLIPYPCLILIDSEIIYVDSVTVNQGSNCLRGYYGSTAASHANGANVFAYHFAYHHNQLAAEIKAICTALGANLSNMLTNGALGGDLSGTFPNPHVISIGNGTLTVAQINVAYTNQHVQNTDTGTTATRFMITTGGAPGTSSSAGTAGQITWDSGFIYVCTATNTWKRVAIATF